MTTETLTEPELKPANRANYKWAVVGMLWFICFLNYADRVAVSSVFPLLADELHFNKFQLGVIGAAFSWTYAGAAPFAGRVGDLFSRKKVILGGLYVWSLVTGLTGVCVKFWQFVAVRATEGFGETFYIPASVSLISDYHGPETRSRAIGIQQTSIYAGTVFGGALAGWMATRYGWRTPFVLLGGAGVILGLILAKFIREPRRGESDIQQAAPTPPPADGRQVAFGAAFGLLFGILLSSVLNALVPKETLSQPYLIGIAAGIVGGLLASRKLWEMFGGICSSPTALLLMVGFIGTNSVFMVFFTWATTYLHEVYHKSLGEAAFWANFPIQSGSMAGAMIGGLMADRIRPRMKGGRILVQAIGTLVGIPFLLLLGAEPGFWVVVGALACFGIAKGIHDANISAGMFDFVPLQTRSAAIGLLNFVGWGAGAIWTIGFGKLVDNKVPMHTLIGSNAGIYAFVCLVFFYAAILRAPKDVAS